MRKWFFLLLLLPLSIHAVKVSFHRLKPTAEVMIPPWFTGPLLAPSSNVVPEGHYNIEPYIYAIANTAKYNSDWKPLKRKTFWSNFSQTSIQIGVVKALDVQLNPTFYYNYTQGAAKWALGDMPIGLDIELYQWGVHLTDWAGGLKLQLKETLPLGKYRNLNPKKLGTDIGGGGSWQTTLGIVWGNLIYLGKGHFFSGRLSLQYALPAPIHVKNLNIYGGGRGTNGTVYPAQNCQADLGIEISLTQEWVFAMDIVGSWAGRTRFKGKTTEPNTAPSSIQYSLAPAIEYNWNGNLGIIFGPWFTVAGRNTVKFTSGIIAFNYYH